MYSEPHVTDIARRAARIFGFSVLFKLIIKLAMFKQRLPKALASKQVLLDIFKFAGANASLSIIFLVTRLTLSALRKYLGLVANGHADNNGTSGSSNIRRLETLELFLSGCAASLATKLYNASDLNLLKVLMYMRGVQGALILIKMLLEKLLNCAHQLYVDSCQIDPFDD